MAVLPGDAHEKRHILRLELFGWQVMVQRPVGLKLEIENIALAMRSLADCARPAAQASSKVAASVSAWVEKEWCMVSGFVLDKTAGVQEFSLAQPPSD